MTHSPLEAVRQWFSAHCDGDWERDLGVRIATLDNPGWSLQVCLERTELEGHSTPWFRDDGDESWLFWRSTGREFEAYGGVNALDRCLEAFVRFAAGEHPMCSERNGETQ